MLARVKTMWLNVLTGILSVPMAGFAGEAIAVGVNIKKGGTDQPLLPVSEYPPWVMELATPQETMFDLRKKLASKGQDNLEELEVRHPLILQYLAESTSTFCTTCLRSYLERS